MEIREILQESLVRANKRQVACQAMLEISALRVANAKMSLQLAQMREATADAANRAATEKHRKLVELCTALPDERVRRALRNEIERFAQEQRATHREAQATAEAVRHCQCELSLAETERSLASAAIETAHDDWSQIAKQVEEANRRH